MILSAHFLWLIITNFSFFSIFIVDVLSNLIIKLTEFIEHGQINDPCLNRPLCFFGGWAGSKHVQRMIHMVAGPARQCKQNNGSACKLPWFSSKIGRRRGLSDVRGG
jgi:hypothetical protein